MPDNAPDSLWNQFNANFKVPDDEDSARIAQDVRASINDWVTKSLADLQSDMASRLSQQLSTFKQSIDQSKAALGGVTDRMQQLDADLAKLQPGDPNLVAAVADLKAKSAAARKAMEDAAKQWEKNGADAVSTAVSVAKTVAMFV